ncbi:MAG: sigma-E processing peptidase SpoIIGA [Acetobacteraceae bacterium]|nr:sigma-E processing peptidase SpoIIGA [Acetobacteraceae bacterium]
MRVRVYLDVLLGVNLAMNWALLWAAARLAGRRVPPWRLPVAAALGAAYGLVVLLPSGWWSGVPARVAVSLAMLAAAFLPVGVRAFLRLAAGFYAASFVAAGGALAAAWLGRPALSAEPASFPAAALGFGLAAGLGLAGWAGGLFRRRAWERLWLVRVDIACGREQVRLTGLLDTGNRLYDPFSHAPVLVAEYRAVEPLIPPGLRGLFGSGLAGAAALDLGLLQAGLGQEAWASRFRAVPYRSIDRGQGLLFGFRPDRIWVWDGGVRLQAGGAVVALQSRPLSPDGSYQALVPPDLVLDADPVRAPARARARAPRPGGRKPGGGKG